MSLWQRLLYALAFVGVANAIALLTLALALPETMIAIFREMHWLVFVELAIAFALAPVLARYIPRRRSNA
jgi:hypothetical protein